MTTEHPIRERIQKAWGYDDYWSRQYDTFQEYIDEQYSGSHREMYDKYKAAALNLENLALEIYNEYNNN